ncbi:MAG: LegC family aminotransferase [Leptospiraceae bacterium]|nr:LegC family aminotransferase [Leptospiraceae bacterium]
MKESELIISRIRKSIGVDTANLHEPLFDGNELYNLKECIDSSFVSSVGKFVDKFENKLTEFTGSKFVVAVVNGTSALHIALVYSGIEPNDEILIPTFSFVATANAVRYCNAIPHFVDIEERTLGLCPKRINDYLIEIGIIKNNVLVNKYTQRPIRAIIPMHCFGHPVDMEGIIDIAKRFNLIVIEDAAESLGSFIKGRHTGTFGNLGILSFNGNKIITTGGGGAILINNENDFKKIKHLTSTAKLYHKWEFSHDQVGYNYRMPNLNAALGCAQLDSLPRFLKQKRNLYNNYKESFSDLNFVSLFSEKENFQSNYWLNALILNPGFQHLKEDILAETNGIGIMTRPVWNLLHTLPMYKDFPKMNLDISQDLFERVINIPSSAGLIHGNN